MNTAVITYQTADGNRGALWFNGDMATIKRQAGDAQVAMSRGKDWTAHGSGRQTFVDGSITATLVIVQR